MDRGKKQCQTDEVPLDRYKTVFTTERGTRHQRRALDAAPGVLEVVMLRAPDRAILRSHLAEATYWISERAGVVDDGLIRAAPRLALILRLGSLWYDVDTEAARAAGVAVCYQPIDSATRVAEHVVLQMLALARRLGEAEAIALEASPRWGESRRTDENTFAFNWSGRQQVEGLRHKTIGIVGLGEIGTELARRLQGWECTLLYYKRRRLPERVEAELGVTYADAGTLLAQSDHVVNLLPYSEDTDHWFDAGAVARMKEGACLVSCGSGSVVDEVALAGAVGAGKVAGAALDTFEWEPIRPTNPLLALAKEGYNVLLTPHVAAAGSVEEVQGRRADYATLLDHIAGRPLQYRVV
jgi:phosphoglycerate dehydrogenase-like enzyme